MPIAPGMNLRAVALLIPERVPLYNGSPQANIFNTAYHDFIATRNAGVAANVTLSDWIAAGGAEPTIRMLLDAYGMNARNSTIVPVPVLQATLAGLPPATINWIQVFSLPLQAPPAAVINPVTGISLSQELCKIYDALAGASAVTVSGGYVAGSKTMHCLFPNLVPMVDGAHTGISYYNINRSSYLPPLNLATWNAWLGWNLNGTPNPSPRGAGRHSWGADQLLAAIGVNQHFFEVWDNENGNPGLAAYLALDPTPGTTGIPRVVDKGLW